jgi:hypothetical protein
MKVFIGRFTSQGKVSFRRAIYFHTPSSEGGKLSNLNNMVGEFEYETDEMGNCSSNTWEWKQIKNCRRLNRVPRRLNPLQFLMPYKEGPLTSV